MWIYLYISVVSQLLLSLQQEKCFGVEFNGEDLKAGEGGELIFISKQVIIMALCFLPQLFWSSAILLLYNKKTKKKALPIYYVGFWVKL